RSRALGRSRRFRPRPPAERPRGLRSRDPLLHRGSTGPPRGPDRPRDDLPPPGPGGARGCSRPGQQPCASRAAFPPRGSRAPAVYPGAAATGRRLKPLVKIATPMERLLAAGCVAAEEELEALVAAAPDDDTLEALIRRREQGE